MGLLHLAPVLRARVGFLILIAMIYSALISFTTCTIGAVFMSFFVKLGLRLTRADLDGLHVGRVVEDSDVRRLGDVFPVARPDLRRHVGEVRRRSSTHFRVARIPSLTTICRSKF